MKICKEKATKKWVSVTGDVGQGRLTYGINVKRLVRIKQNKSVLNTTIHPPTLTGRSLRWERSDECGAMVVIAVVLTAWSAVFFFQARKKNEGGDSTE